MTHVLDAEGRIKEVVDIIDVELASLEDYVRGSIITGGAADWGAYDAKTLGAILVGDGVDILSTINPTIAGVITAVDHLVGNGGTYGIDGAELLTFNAAGTAVFSGCDVGIGGAPAAPAGVTARTTIINTTTNLLTLSAAATVVKDLHWFDSTSGESWIASHRTDALGNQLEFWYYSGAAWNATPNLALTPAGRAGFGLTGPAAKCHIDQSVNDAAIPVLALDQADLDEAFIEYIGASAANANNPISTWTTGATIQGFVRVDVNGVGYWMPYYTAPTG